MANGCVLDAFDGQEVRLISLPLGHCRSDEDLVDDEEQ